MNKFTMCSFEGSVLQFGKNGFGLGWADRDERCGFRFGPRFTEHTLCLGAVFSCCVRMFAAHQEEQHLLDSYRIVFLEVPSKPWKVQFLSAPPTPNRPNCPTPNRHGAQRGAVPGDHIPRAEARRLLDQPGAAGVPLVRQLVGWDWYEGVWKVVGWGLVSWSQLRRLLDQPGAAGVPLLCRLGLG